MNLIYVFVHESDLSGELNLAAIQDLILMTLTSFLWSSVKVLSLLQLYLVMFCLICFQLILSVYLQWLIKHIHFLGNFDDINQPKNISEYSKETVCFFMFIDEVTEAYVKSAGTMDSSRKIGVWRVVVVRNLPYTDGRRTGKVGFCKYLPS